jgi:DNA-binding NarL/FixJ family response regulator
MNIFISDDSPVVRVRLTHIFEDIEGVKIVGEGHNVKDSIDSIQKLKPDAVILDLNLPDGNGIEVLKSIKNSNSRIIVIVLTNYPFPQYKKICMELGADYFFDKSNDFNRIVDIVKEM